MTKRRTLLLIVTLLSFRSTTLRGADDPFSFSKIDKQLHLVAGQAMTLTGTAVLHRYEMPRWKAFFISALTTMALEVAKEVTVDKEFSGNDVAFTAMGVAGTGLLIFAFDLFPPPSPISLKGNSP